MVYVGLYLYIIISYIYLHYIYIYIYIYKYKIYIHVFVIYTNQGSFCWFITVGADNANQSNCYYGMRQSLQTGASITNQSNYYKLGHNNSCTFLSRQCGFLRPSIINFESRKLEANLLSVVSEISTLFCVISFNR